MKVYLLDDEQKAITTLQFLLSEYFPDVVVCGSNTDASKARVEILAQKPDLLFSDISMPFENGLEFAETIEFMDILVVFVTAHPNHAIEAFKVNAFGYLLKPVQLKELIHVMQRAKKELEKQSAQAANQSPATLKIRHEGKILLTEAHQVLYIHSEGNYSEIHFTTGKSIVISKNIKQLEELYFAEMPFFRTHQSFIVNLTKVNQYSTTEAKLGDTITIPVSRQKKDAFVKLMENI